MRIKTFNFKSFLLILFAIIAFAMLRFFQDHIFYDPFISFFKSNYQNVSYPNLVASKFYFSTFFRFIINSFLSLLVIHTIFKNRDILKFISVLYLFFGIILVFLLVWELYFSTTKSPFLLFYIRRFLIQPLFLLLFIPALFFQSKYQA